MLNCGGDILPFPLTFQTNKMNRPTHLYAHAEVVAVVSPALARYRDREYRVEIFPEDIIRHNITAKRQQRPAVRAKDTNFHKADVPQVGDIVLLQCRISEEYPNWGEIKDPIITKILTRNG